MPKIVIMLLAAAVGLYAMGVVAQKMAQKQLI